MSQNRLAITDMRTMLLNAISQAVAAHTKGETYDHIAEERLNWFLHDARNGTGWSGQRITWPDKDYTHRGKLFQRLHYDDDLTWVEIGRIYNLTPEAVQIAAGKAGQS